jgi:hypothetical protein
MRRHSVLVTLAAAAVLLGSAGTSAAQQSLTLSIGGFNPRGEDGRANIDGGSSADVLVNNLDFLAFNIDDFRGLALSAEWLTALGSNFEAGLGIGRYSRKVPSVYRDYIDLDASEIEQDLRLRTIPFSATIRFLPLGRNSGVQPYLGGGIGVINWRYTESGDFVDFSDFSIFRGTFVGSGTTAGPMVLGGLRFPVGSSDIGGEIRYQHAEGDLPESEGFSSTTIDLGGVSYLATFNIRF